MDPNSNDELLELYFDGLMSTEEATQFESTFDLSLLEREREQQQQLDGALKRLMSDASFDEESIVSQYAEKHNLRVSVAPQRVVEVARRNWLQLAVVASLMCVLGTVAWVLSVDASSAPVFAARPLTSVYAETVSRGFRPYYNCEDPTRFRDAFAHALKQPLALAQMPAGTKMLGLSRLGGVSRKTMAMLGEVDGSRVIVFVDNVEAGGLAAAVKPDPRHGQLNTFVREIDGLVFCEVTPLSEPRLIEHFQFVD